MQLPGNSELVEVGVDWLTATATDEAKGRSLLAQGERILRNCVSAGEDPSVFKWKGYDGWCVGGCDVGVRHDSVMVRVHGHLADQEWRKLVHVSQNWTRLDLQQTWRMPDQNPDVVLGKAWRSAKRAKLHGKPVQWHYERDIKRGDTLELGRRTSEQFGRLYNKHLESKLDYYANCIRMECEFKKDQARNRVLYLVKTDDVENAIARQVCTWWTDRGVSSSRLPGPALRIRSRALRQDPDKACQWLSTSVKGCVERVAARKGLPAVLKALGLDHVVQIRSDVDHVVQYNTMKEKHNATVQSSLDWFFTWSSTRERFSHEE